MRWVCNSFYCSRHIDWQVPMPKIFSPNKNAHPFSMFSYLFLKRKKEKKKISYRGKVNWVGAFPVHPEVPISFSLVIGPDYSIMLLWEGHQSSKQQACYLPSLRLYPFTPGSREMSYFSPLYQLQLSISQNRPVPLVSCFVGVHHVSDAIWESPLDVANDILINSLK